MDKLVKSKKGVVRARSARLMRKMIRHKKSLKRYGSVQRTYSLAMAVPLEQVTSR